MDSQPPKVTPIPNSEQSPNTALAKRAMAIIADIEQAVQSNMPYSVELGKGIQLNVTKPEGATDPIYKFNIANFSREGVEAWFAVLAQLFTERRAQAHGGKQRMFYGVYNVIDVLPVSQVLNGEILKFVRNFARTENGAEGVIVYTVQGVNIITALINSIANKVQKRSASQTSQTISLGNMDYYLFQPNKPDEVEQFFINYMNNGENLSEG